MVSFEFVVSNGIPKRATAAVRSHAVRNGLSQKHKDGVAASGQENSQLTIHQKSSLRGRFKLNDDQKKPGSKKRQCPLAKRKAAKAAAAAAAAAAASESESQAVPGFQDGQQMMVASPPIYRGPVSPRKGPKIANPSKRADPIISVFLSYMDIHMSCSNITRKYFGFGLCDPLVLHTALGVTAMMFSIALPNPKKGFNEAYKQKALAIPGVHERLEANDISNAVVGAIANLAQMEIIEKDLAAARVHLDAIDLIAKRKGGYGSFASDLPLATTLNWVDILVAFVTDSKPSMVLLTSADTVPIDSRALKMAAEPGLEHLKSFEMTPVDTTLRWTFTEVRQALYAYAFDLDVTDRRILCNGIDHRLAMLLQVIPRTSPAYPMLLGIQLFVALVVRSTEVGCGLIRLLIPRLMRSLTPRLDGTIPVSQENLLGIVWCLWIGLVTNSPRGDSAIWFCQHLGHLLPQVGIVDATQFKTEMQRFLWDDFRCETTLLELGPTFFNLNLSLRQVTEVPSEGSVLESPGVEQPAKTGTA